MEVTRGSFYCHGSYLEAPSKWMGKIIASSGAQGGEGIEKYGSSLCDPSCYPRNIPTVAHAFLFGRAARFGVGDSIARVWGCGEPI